MPCFSRVIVGIFIAWLSFYGLTGFVLLSGPAKATLNVSPSKPTVTFVWDESAPTLTSLDSWVGGKYKDLSDKDAMEQIIIAALDHWSSTPDSYLKFKLVKDPSAVANANDKKHVIYVQHNSDISTAAFASPNIQGNLITDCDVAISNTSVDASTLEFTMTHELGHCLGLGHNHSNYDAIMSYARLSDSANPGADDYAGIIYLYPAANSGATRRHAREMAICGGLAPGGGSSGGSAPLFALLPLLLVGVCYLRGQRTQRRRAA